MRLVYKIGADFKQHLYVMTIVLNQVTQLVPQVLRMYNITVKSKFIFTQKIG